MNFYNEIDPFAAEWLRQLIRGGHIANGIVDERSIVEIEANELRGYTQCHFFAGIGGWSYALRLAGWPDDRPVWTGSCPCQPFSLIGSQRGKEDERHLWPEFHRLIAECRPPVVFGEQVAGKLGLEWLTGVRTDLESDSYAVGAASLCAAAVSAPHRRQRIYWMAHASREGLERFSGHGDGGNKPGRDEAESCRPTAETGPIGSDASSVDAMHMLRRVYLHDSRGARLRLRVSRDRGVERDGDESLWSRFEHVACADGWRRVEPGSFPLAHGVSARVGRLRAYGNAIVPQVAACFVETVMGDA